MLTASGPVTIADVGQLLVKQREDSTSSSQSRTEVSEELTREASRRLGIAAWVVGAVMLLYVLLYMTIWAEPLASSSDIETAPADTAVPEPAE